MPTYRIFVTPWGASQNSVFTAVYPPRWGWRVDGVGTGVAPQTLELNMAEATMTWGLNQAGTFRGKLLKRMFSSSTSGSGGGHVLVETSDGLLAENSSFLSQESSGSSAATVVPTATYQAMEPGRHAIWVQRDEVLIWAGIIWDITGDSGSDLIEVVAEEFPSYWQKARWDWLWTPTAGPPAFNPDIGTSQRDFGYFKMMEVFNNFMAQQSGGVALNLSHVIQNAYYLNIPAAGDQYYLQMQPTDYRVLMDIVRDLQSVGADLGPGHGFEWTTRYIMSGPGLASDKSNVQVIQLDNSIGFNGAGGFMDLYGSGAYWTIWSPFAGITRTFPQIGWGNVSNSNALGVKWSYSARPTATRYRVVGYGDRAAGWVTSVASSFHDSYPAGVDWPRFDETYTNQWLRTAQATSAASLRNINYRVRPQMVLHARVRPGPQFPFGSVSVGDTILCALDDAYITFTGYFRIQELQLTASSQDEVYELTLQPPSGLSGAQAPLAVGGVSPIINTNIPNRVAILGDDVMLGAGTINPTADAWWQQARLNLSQGAGAIWDTSRCAGANSLWVIPPTAPGIFCLNAAGGGPAFMAKVAAEGATTVIFALGLYDCLYYGQLAAQGFTVNTNTVWSGMINILSTYVNAASAQYVAGSTTRLMKWFVCTIPPLPQTHKAWNSIFENIRVPFNQQLNNFWPNNMLDMASAIQQSPSVWQIRNPSYTITANDYHINTAGHTQMYLKAAAKQVWL